MAEASEARRIAVDRKLLIACPMHPNQIIATSDGAELPQRLHPEIKREIEDLLARTPKICPRCMDRDDG